jgi:hypothetical protein
LRRVRDRVHTNARLQRCRRSASHTKRVGHPSESCDAGCTGTLLGELGCCCRLPQGMGLCWFRGRGFWCLERPCSVAGRGLFPSRSARRRGAVPSLEMAPCGSRSRGGSPERPCTGELAIGVGQLDPGASPPPLQLRRPPWAVITSMSDPLDIRGRLAA